MTPIVSALMGLFILGTPQSGWAAQATSTPVVQLPSYEITLTGYNAVPAQTDSDPLVTASGAFSNPEVVAARSQDLADELPFGTVISISNATSTPDCGLPLVHDQIGLRVIADSMNARMRNKVDVLFATDDYVKQGGMQRNAASALGFCRGVVITVVGHIDISHMPKTQAELATMLDKSETLAVAK